MRSRAVSASRSLRAFLRVVQASGRERPAERDGGAVWRDARRRVAHAAGRQLDRLARAGERHQPEVRPVSIAVNEAAHDHGEAPVRRDVVLLEHDLRSDDGLGIGSARHAPERTRGAGSCVVARGRVDCQPRDQPAAPIPRAVPRPDRAGPRAAARPGDRQPVPADAQRRHHQRRRRQGRHGLHRPDRRADAPRLARRSASPRSSACTGAPRSRWASGATSAARSSGRSRRFSQVEVNKFGTPSLITRNTNDVQQVQTVVFMALTLMISAPILIVGGIIMALRQDVPLSGLLIVVLPLMVAFIALVMSPRDPALPGACRSSSTGSTRSCARRSPACA